MEVLPDNPDRSDLDYNEALAQEGAFWDNFIANRLLQHKEIPGSVDFRLFFTQFSYRHAWGPPCLGPLAINFREKEIRYIITRAARKPGARILDLGCGAGWLSLELARQGAHVTAVDVSPTNLALGRYIAHTNARNFPYLYQKFAGLPCLLDRFGSVEYVSADLNNINLPIAEYDSVVAWDSLHHVRDLERLLEQVRASLKLDGVFVGLDHAYATPLTIAFNDSLAPWIKDLDALMTSANREAQYARINSLASERDWGLLSVDYNTKPVEGFDSFEAQVREEMLDIIRGSAQRKTVVIGQIATEDPAGNSKESPFEDVSAERLITTLIQNFKAQRLYTVGPLIMPEQHFSRPRTEDERIFQHYIAAGLVEICERAVDRGQADGQWFLFDLSPERAFEVERSPELERLLSTRSAESVVRESHTSAQELAHMSHRVAQLQEELSALAGTFTESRQFAAFLEQEVSRKNRAIQDMEERLLKLETALIEARKPRLPWKRRSKTGK